MHRRTNVDYLMHDNVSQTIFDDGVGHATLFILKKEGLSKRCR